MRKEQFELLCKDGTRRAINDYKVCNWGTVPSRAIVTSSATNFNVRKLYQRFLEKAVRIMHKTNVKTNTTRDFVSNRFDDLQGNYGNRSGNNNRFGVNTFNRDGDGFNNQNEYSTDNWRRYGNDRASADDGSNPRKAANDGFNYYNRDYTSTEPNIQPIEVFELFESAPRYGTHNLMFSVRFMFHLFLSNDL